MERDKEKITNKFKKALLIGNSREISVAEFYICKKNSEFFADIKFVKNKAL